MPYKDTHSLPKQVTDNLPLHAQVIYLEVFNNALKQYKDPKKRHDKNEDIEQVASKVAWAAVKKKYKKTTESKDVKWEEK